MHKNVKIKQQQQQHPQIFQNKITKAAFANPFPL
jgi:hypothetical protein